MILAALLITNLVFAGNIDWISVFESSRYEGDFQNCMVGSNTNITDCHVVVEFGQRDKFGALVGEWDLGAANQRYEVTLEHFPQADNAYKIGIKRAGYTRRLNSKDDVEDTLNFWPGPGDIEPTVIKMVSLDALSNSIELIFKQQMPMKHESYFMQGTLLKK